MIWQQSHMALIKNIFIIPLLYEILEYNIKINYNKSEIWIGVKFFEK